MNHIIWPLIGSLAATILIFGVIVYLFKKKREHQDFLLSIIILVIFFVLALYMSFLSVQQVLDNTNRSVVCGECTITIIEDVGGRFGSYSLINVEINDLTLDANPNQFPDLEEGKYKCKVEYSKNVETIYSLEIE